MPHQCTDCGRAFADGSKEMLSGCPDCGGTTFQYLPEGADPADTPDDEPPEPPEPDEPGSVARTVGSAATAVRDMVSPDPSPGQGRDEHPADPAGPGPDAETGRDGDARPGPPETPEDTAQADARSEVVPPEDLPPADTADPGDAAGDPRGSAADDGRGTPESVAPRDRPDLADLREELNDQFESIRVVEPGQYELNLMGLYDREAYIIALQEDGKYTIQVPEHWKE